MSYGQYHWLTKRTWIPNTDFRRGPYIVVIWTPRSILNRALLSIILSVAHMEKPVPAFGVELASTPVGTAF